MGPHWFVSYTKGPFLLKTWWTNTASGLVAAILFSFALAIGYECMNYAYHVYHLRAEKWHTRQNKVVAHVLLSLLRTISVVAAYVIMLCVMTFNLWIFISVIVGSGLGHFLGRPLISSALKKKHKPRDQDANELLYDFKDSKECSETERNSRTTNKSQSLL